MATNQSQSTSSDGTLIGRIIVERGLASSEEVTRNLQQWREAATDQRGTLADWLVEHGVVTRGQIDELNQQLAAQKHEGQIPGYRILDRIGAGAMASVFKAQQLSLDRTVAIKILPRRHITDDSFVQRFYAEGRAAARLNHPNIVQAIDVGRAGDHHYFVMEMVEGHTVFDHLQKYHRYDEAEALRIVIQTAEALHHAHEKGFIHRDVKPKNIMITPEGTAKLADMGLARQVSDREAAEREAGRAFGTPYYISPEQIRGEVDIDSRCDIYGLGATFYHMVTGRVPFDAPSPSMVMQKHLREELTPPDHVVPDLSAGVGEIIEVMMAKSPEARYATTADLLEDLRGVANGMPPLHARRKFSIASLAALEDTVDNYNARTIEEPPGTLTQMTSHPLFWVTAASVLLNVILLIALMVR